MSIFFLDRDEALTVAPLRALIEVDSAKVEDYVPAFQALLASSFLPDLLRRTLGDLDGLRARLDKSCEERDWRLLLTDRFSLGVRKLPSFSLLDGDRKVVAPGMGQRFLTALPNDVLVGVCGKGSITADHYRSAFARDQEVFDRRHRVELVGRRTYVPGEHLMMHASEEIADMLEVKGDLAVLEFALTDARRIVWNYDAETKQAAFASSGSVDATRIEFAMEMFRLFKAKKALPTLLRIAREHGHHWVRWKAVKIMLQLDVTAGLEALEAARQDPHQHVRKAAESTLANFRNANLIAA
jgi:hypothetical protein